MLFLGLLTFLIAIWSAWRREEHAVPVQLGGWITLKGGLRIGGYLPRNIAELSLLTALLCVHRRRAPKSTGRPCHRACSRARSWGCAGSSVALSLQLFLYVFLYHFSLCLILCSSLSACF